MPPRYGPSFVTLFFTKLNHRYRVTVGIPSLVPYTRFYGQSRFVFNDVMRARNLSQIGSNYGGFTYGYRHGFSTNPFVIGQTLSSRKSRDFR